VSGSGGGDGGGGDGGSVGFMKDTKEEYRRQETKALVCGGLKRKTSETPITTAAATRRCSVGSKADEMMR